MKKLLSFFAVTLFVLALVACGGKTYKVTLDLNYEGAPASKVVEVKKGAALSEQDEPVRDGYVFVEWQLDGAKWTFDKVVEKNITLKAIWEEDVEDVVYTVTFDVNGGSPAVDEQQVNKDELATKPEAPTLKDKAFAGWYLDGELYDFASPIVKDITLKAEWGEGVLVTFDVNGGTGEVADQFILINSLAKEPEAPTLANHTFLGWYVGSAKWNFGVTVEHSLDLVAKWQIDTNRVTFNLDDGKYAKDEEGKTLGDAQAVEYNKNAVQPAEPPVRAGFEFVGWYEIVDVITTTVTNQKGEVLKKTEVHILAEEPYDFEEIVKAPTNLKAVWNLTGHTIKLNLGYLDKEGEELTLPNLYADDNGIIEEPETPTREKYEFLGWYLGEEEFDFETPITADIELVAHWIELKIVTFELYEDEEQVKAVRLGDKVEALEPERFGHTFLGWFLEDEGFDFETPITEDIKLVAKWEELPKVKVTFDLDYTGAPEPEVVEVYKDTLAEEPEVPIRVGYEFKEWLLNGVAFDFSEEKISENTVLKASWTKVADVTVSFNTKLEGVTIPNKVVSVHSDVADPSLGLASFKKDGYRFAGWYKTMAGAVWNEPKALEFPLNPTENITVHAYWEPIDSKAVNYGKDQTYTSTMTQDSRLILNPLEYRWSHEDEFVDMLAAALYATEVDWDKAIADGIASYAGDFSKIGVEGGYSIDAFDYHYVLIGGAQYPINEKGETAVIDGKFNRDLAQTIKGKQWTYHIRDDLVFEDGTKIDARTFEFTLKNWIDPDQNNFRANMWYKNSDNENGRPLVGTEDYYTGVGKWEDVGFKLGQADANGNIYSFTIYTTEEITLSSAVSMGNDLRLLHPGKYTASIDAASGKAQYGTPAHPYVSYGAYVLKSWDENQMLVFNKNYDYVAKHTINYKSRAVQVVSDVAESYNLYKNGETSVLGLNKEYYAEYAEDPNVKDSWVNYPQYMIINQAASKLGAQGHQHQTIMGDEKFRQALLYGFNRKEFAYNIYAPNTPALLPIPSNAKNYMFDPIYYTESTQHMDVIEVLGLEMDDYGYSPARAQSLFNEAYNKWISEGNTGPVTLRYITSTAEFNISLDQYIKESYENLFAAQDGTKRLIIDVVPLSATALQYNQQNHNFDLTLTSLGFGSALDGYWQYIAIAIYPAAIGASGFGLYYPYVGGPDENGKYQTAEYLEWEIEVDFTSTYNYLVGLGDDIEENDEKFLVMLDENGVYKGTVDEISRYILYTSPNVFDGGPNEPYQGASNDLNNLIAALEKVFFKYVPVIPTVTRSSATIYADNVVIEWPVYSDAFGWGAERYRFLNADPDFADRK